ncbi:Zinc finger protein ubi-d4 [Halocaridina rubra]|uniref:Zinc finger protein ubi-d4 n=1 Tax=Halocaridina rubra TaxID=373956 RepID=A0AAN9ACX2_HALRR
MSDVNKRCAPKSDKKHFFKFFFLISSTSKPSQFSRFSQVMAVATVETTTLEKIINFVKDNGYQELMQNSARYNARIRKDRLYRQPYIDGQTGVAQRHCHLFVSDKHRMPGILQGQVYTYPARRWRTQRRSYLGSLMQAARADPDEHTITTVENPAAIITTEEEPVVAEKVVAPPETWATYYEEPTFEDELEEDFESEEDFDDETYSRKGSKRKKPTGGRKPKAALGITKKNTKKKTSDGTSQRGPKKKPPGKTPTKTPKTAKKDEDDTTGKPYVCELCGMRYKTRPGLTYHYAHSHKEDDKEDTKAKARANEQTQPNDSTPDYLTGTPQTPANPNWGQNLSKVSF